MLWVSPEFWQSNSTGFCPTWAPEWDDWKPPPGWGWSQDSRAHKTHCPKMHMVTFLLSLDFMIDETTLGSKDVAISCISLFLPFSTSNFLLYFITHNSPSLFSAMKTLFCSHATQPLSYFMCFELDTHKKILG